MPSDDDDGALVQKDRTDAVQPSVDALSARLDEIEQALRQMNVALVRTQGWIGVVAEGRVPLVARMRATTQTPKPPKPMARPSRGNAPEKLSVA